MMVIDAPPGEGEIRLEFVTPLENHVGRAVALIMRRWHWDGSANRRSRP